MTVSADKLVTCKRCGEKNLAWQLSRKGSYYLCRVFLRDGLYTVDRSDFHDCPGRAGSKSQPSQSVPAGPSPEVRSTAELVINLGYKYLVDKYKDSKTEMELLTEAVRYLRREPKEITIGGNDKDEDF